MINCVSFSLKKNLRIFLWKYESLSSNGVKDEKKFSHTSLTKSLFSTISTALKLLRHELWENVTIIQQLYIVNIIRLKLIWGYHKIHWKSRLFWYKNPYLVHQVPEISSHKNDCQKSSNNSTNVCLHRMKSRLLESWPDGAFINMYRTGYGLDRWISFPSERSDINSHCVKSLDMLNKLLT